ncbi:hypothetical protein [Solilutibacter tolerans]|uniref:Uncharacterized protein n=1 Tax=Solilutibacter tolerans TaxID=1604334 RepID=A0A1N6Y289_9GAMM|nr:hypothetical protein [Lysobacter tolerans]SIR08752.1 hypothetical protein SAMN05421546_2354 [Lysobacter tolerans]
MSGRCKGALVVALALLLSACGSPSLERAAQDAAAIALHPSADIEDDPPALNAAVFVALAGDLPGLAAHQTEAGRREKAALKAVFAEYRQWEASRNGTETANTARTPFKASPQPIVSYPAQRPARHFNPLDWIVPPAQAMGVAPSAPGTGDFAATMGGHVATSIFGTLGDGGKPGLPEHKSVEFKGDGGESASLDVAVDANGQVTGSIASNSAIAPLGIEAKSKVSFVATTLCPDSAGRVEFTVKLSQGGVSGPGGTNYTRNLEAHVVATVDDNANVSDTQIDTKYDQRSGSGANASSMHGRTSWSSPGGPTAPATTTSHAITRQSGDGAKAQQMADEGARHALMLGNGALLAAEKHWQGGHCIRIDAKSPGRVSPGRRSTIPVKVFSKQDAAEIQAKVTAALSGGKSVDPTEIPRSPGEITHTAPDERTKSMSIKLVAVSRRGKAELTLSMSMNEGQYRAEGGAGEFHGSGVICDIAQPFTISGSGVTVTFTPTSEDGGSYTYSGSMSGFQVWGNGTYAVGYADYGETASTISATGPGSVKTPMGTVSATDSEEYTLTKITDDACGK